VSDDPEPPDELDDQVDDPDDPGQIDDPDEVDEPDNPDDVERQIDDPDEVDEPDNPDNVERQIERVRAWVDESDHVVVLTGAGISTDSGIPDFRGPDGVWTRDPEAEKRATLQHYMADPQVRRRAWRDRLEHPAWTAEPNAGHRAITELERRGKLDRVITQNVDGLQQAAGTDPARVIEVHGTVHDVVCMSCGERAPMQRALDRVRAGEADPHCRTCGGILKSATISFGQNLVPTDIEAASSAARRADLLLAVGSTLAVYPVADVVPVARMSGARIVIVNASETAMDHLADVVLRGSISDLLPRLVAG
jgi:NAD-dependent deacetylase